MSPTHNSLSDAELGELLLSASARRTAARELTRRYGDALLAYAGALCATPQDAHTLATAALGRSLDSSQRGELPGPSWTCRLFAEARLLAAAWAATGRGGDLSPDFRAWLAVRKAPHQSYRDVVATAEENSPLLGALEQLPDRTVTQLWRALTPGPGAGPAPAADAVPPPAARRGLADAYIRVHAVGAPDRRCRHLAALLSETASGGTAASTELATHLPRCPRCHRALDDLRAVHRWEADHLRDALLLRFRASVAGRTTALLTTAPEAPGPGPADAPAPPREESSAEVVIGAAHRRTDRPARHEAARRRLAIGAAGLGTVALALGLAMAEPPAVDVTGSPVPDRVPVTGPDVIGPDPAAPGTAGPSAAPVPPTSAAPTVRRTPTPGRSTPRAPTGTRPALPPAPSAPEPAAAPGAVSTPSTPATPSAPPPVTPSSPPSAAQTATALPSARALRRGDSGPDVVALQKLLVEAGCAPTDPTFARGRFDAATERYLADFQQAAGVGGEERNLVAYGARTRAALEQAMAGPRCRPGQPGR
ncbi:peptidoglycan-binding protein [Kitasatospora sp. NPDC003701]